MKSTHTYVELPVSKAAHDEISAKLKAAGYDHAFDGETIHMQGLALSIDKSAPPLGYVLVELDRINTLTERVKALALAGSADAKSLAADAALLLDSQVRHG